MRQDGLYFYPRHPRGWRQPNQGQDIQTGDISIHATLAGGDRRGPLAVYVLFISIHATLAGGDVSALVCIIRQVLFLSTPPSRVATSALV